MLHAGSGRELIHAQRVLLFPCEYWGRLAYNRMRVQECAPSRVLKAHRSREHWQDCCTVWGPALFGLCKFVLLTKGDMLLHHCCTHVRGVVLSL